MRTLLFCFVFLWSCYQLLSMRVFQKPMSIRVLHWQWGCPNTNVANARDNCTSKISRNQPIQKYNKSTCISLMLGMYCSWLRYDKLPTQYFNSCRTSSIPGIIETYLQFYCLLAHWNSAGVPSPLKNMTCFHTNAIPCPLTSSLAKNQGIDSVSHSRLTVWSLKVSKA